MPRKSHMKYLLLLVASIDICLSQRGDELDFSRWNSTPLHNSRRRDRINHRRYGKGHNSPSIEQCPPVEDTCPCVKVDGSNQLYSYDSSLMASTLDEAIEHFSDPVAGRTAKDILNDKPEQNTPEQRSSKQSSDPCKKASILDNLTKIQKDTGRSSILANTIAKVPNWLNESLDTFLNSQCRSRASIAHEPIMEMYGNNINNCISNYTNSYLFNADIIKAVSSSPEILDSIQKFRDRFTSDGAARRRLKRQTAIGKTYTMSCVNRGEADGQNPHDNYVNLCNMCWSWRLLPSDYYPRYVNELVCTSDTTCLRGYGQCKTRNRNINVLRKVNGAYEQVSIASSTSCDCRVIIGSPLHSWVSG